MRKLYLIIVGIAGCLIGLNSQAIGQTLAFPTAEGFGKHATGGRGGDVYIVTNLDDSGEGSLRNGINQSGKRTIVFEIGGTIELESDLSIDNGNITIAGQTAPGGGITVSNYPLRVSADNVIIRYIRSRLGDRRKDQQSDAFTAFDNNKNIIIDHCSFSWSIDETASMYSVKNLTLQWSMVTESLNDAHHEKGEHGYGGIWGGDSVTFHHNLIAHHTSRNPRFNGRRYNSDWNDISDFRNNVIYNWESNSVYGGDPNGDDGLKAHINMVNNYFKPGPATGGSADRIVEPYDANGEFSVFHLDGNFVYEDEEVTNNNWEGLDGVGSSQIDDVKSEEPFAFDITTEHSAVEAYNWVLENVGVKVPMYDTIDKRVIYETATATATYGDDGIIDSQEDVGGYPDLPAGSPEADSDGDGMPNSWEEDKGLDPNDASDRNGDLDDDGYTNLEEYLNSLVSNDEPFETPGNLTAEDIGQTQVQLTWNDDNDSNTGYVIERSMDENTGFEIIAEVGADETSYTDRVDISDDQGFYYRIKAVDDNNRSSYYSSTVFVRVDFSITGSKIIKGEGFNIYPVPVNNEANIDFKLKESGSVNILLMDVYGNQYDIINKKYFEEGSHSIDISVNDIESGVYIIRLSRNGKSLQQQKIIVN